MWSWHTDNKIFGCIYNVILEHRQVHLYWTAGTLTGLKNWIVGLPDTNNRNTFTTDANALPIFMAELAWVGGFRQVCLRSLVPHHVWAGGYQISVSHSILDWNVYIMAYSHRLYPSLGQQTGELIKKSQESYLNSLYG